MATVLVSTHGSTSDRLTQPGTSPSDHSRWIRPRLPCICPWWRVLQVQAIHRFLLRRPERPGSNDRACEQCSVCALDRPSRRVALGLDRLHAQRAPAPRANVVCRSPCHRLLGGVLPWRQPRHGNMDRSAGSHITHAPHDHLEQDDRHTHLQVSLSLGDGGTGNSPTHAHPTTGTLWTAGTYGLTPRGPCGGLDSSATAHA